MTGRPTRALLFCFIKIILRIFLSIIDHISHWSQSTWRSCKVRKYFYAWPWKAVGIDIGHSCMTVSHKQVIVTSLRPTELLSAELLSEKSVPLSFSRIGSHYLLCVFYCLSICFWKAKGVASNCLQIARKRIKTIDLFIQAYLVSHDLLVRGHCTVCSRLRNPYNTNSKEQFSVVTWWVMWGYRREGSSP